MKSVYLIRTAAAASLIAAVIGLASLGWQEEEAQVAPATPAAASEPASSYFPAAYELKPGADEGQVFEYY